MTSEAEAQFLKQFGASIAQRRRRLGLSQEYIAFTAGLSVSTLSQLELGKVGINTKRLPAVAAALDCTVAELFQDS